MSCSTGLIADVFIVRWFEPAAADVPEIVQRVREHAAAAGKKLHYVALVGSEVPVPDDEVRRALADSIDDVLEVCDTMHMVIEGQGLRRAIVRSLSTSIILLSRHRGRTFAHDTLDRALARIVGDDPARIEAMVAEARLKGLAQPSPAAPAGT